MDQLTSSSYERVSIDIPRTIWSCLCGDHMGKMARLGSLEISYKGTCEIENAVGRVVVSVKDNRLAMEEDKLQARFTFPVRAHLTCKFYGSAWIPYNSSFGIFFEESPWLVSIVLEQSNLDNNVDYCKVRARARFATTSSSTITKKGGFRPPEIIIHSKEYSSDDVTVWHVPAKPLPILPTIGSMHGS